MQTNKNSTTSTVKTDTILRTVALLFALINQILAAIGKSPLPFESDDLIQVISTSITIVTSLIAFWKNNSFTSNAIAADEYLKVLNNNNN